MKINIILFAAIFGVLAVLIGAFGAHGLERAAFSAKALKSFHTGVEYQFYHVFALLFIGLLNRHSPSRLLEYTAWFFSIGIVLFSGSLYTYVLTGMRGFAMITPIGGLTFIFAWVLLIVFSVKNSSQ